MLNCVQTDVSVAERGKSFCRCNMLQKTFKFVEQKHFQSKETSILWSHHEETRKLEKQIMQGTMPGACRQGRPYTAWMDDIKTWTGLHVKESIRMTEDRYKWRKYVHGVVNPRIEDG